MAREDLHFRLRIPEELKSQVEIAASQNHRSMTAEIIDRLEASFAQKKGTEARHWQHPVPPNHRSIHRPQVYAPELRYLRETRFIDLLQLTRTYAGALHLAETAIAEVIRALAEVDLLIEHRETTGRTFKAFLRFALGLVSKTAAKDNGIAVTADENSALDKIGGDFSKVDAAILAYLHQQYLVLPAGLEIPSHPRVDSASDTLTPGTLSETENKRKTLLQRLADVGLGKPDASKSAEAKTTQSDPLKPPRRKLQL